MTLKKVKFRYVFGIYAAVMSYVCFFLIHPAHDDWSYCAPKPAMDIIAGLMPTKVYWRPFDRLIEYLLGFAPFLFPVINHVLVLSAHFTLCAVLYLLIRKITHRRLFAAAGTLFFCLNTGIVYTITNTDTINQSWAMLAGAASTFYFFKARLEGKDRLYS